MKSTWLLLLLTLLAASLEPILAKLGYRWGVDPWQLLYLKSLVGGLLIAPLALRHRPQRQAIPAALLLLFTTTCLLWAVQRLPAATVITLVSTTPAFVALLNQRSGRERPSPRFWLGLLACLLGIVLSLGQGLQARGLDPVGLLLVGLAIASSSLYRTRLEALTRSFSSLQVSATIFLLHGVLALGLGPQLRPIGVSGYAIGIWLGVTAVAANLSFVYAIGLLGSTNMSMFNLLQRPLVVVAAALVLGEHLSLWQWLGVLLVVVGVRTSSQSGNTITGPVTLPSRGKDGVDLS